MVSSRLCIVFGLAASVMASPARAACDRLLPTASEAVARVRGITKADLIELRDIGSPEAWVYSGVSPLALSPDGKSIAFVINQADIATNSYCRALVVMPAAGGTPRIIDRGGEYMIVADEVRGLIQPVGGGVMVVPRWSPDGKRVGFLKRMNSVTQVWEARADGAGARAITSSPTDVEKWGWSSNMTIVFESRTAMAKVERATDAEGLSGWRYDGRVMTFDGFRPQVLNKDAPKIGIALDVATRRTRPPTPAEAALLARIPSLTAATDAGVVAPDGSRAGITASPVNPQVPRRIWITDKTGKRTDCAFEACSGSVTQLWWDNDGSLLFLRREGRARSEFAVYRWRIGTGEPQRLFRSADWFHACLLDGGRLICTAEGSSQPSRIVAIDLATGASSVVFDPNPGFARLALGKVERVFTRNETGQDAWIDLVLPPDYQPGQKLPVVVVQYLSQGFLRGGTGNDYPIFALAQAGFAVISFQRPPTFGLGNPQLDTWDKAIAAGTKDWANRRNILSSLLNGLDQVEARGMADPKRVGITGLSDGMSTIEYALINTKRFSAAALSSCCEDPKTVMTYGGIVWADWNHDVRGYPRATEDPSVFWKAMSISLNARAIDTPILMQLADREALGGLEAFTALREQKKPVDLYVFPDEYHMKWQPRHRLAIYERSIDWFAFWLNGVERPGPGKTEQYRHWRSLRNMRTGGP